MIHQNDLTRKQQNFLLFIQEFVRETGTWPSYSDLAQQFDYRSPNSVTQNLQALTKKGYLHKDQNGYRLTHKDANANESEGIPVRGVIAAGRLQEAVEAHLGMITPDVLPRQSKRMFALRVSGQSMIGAGIQSGDYVLLIDEDIPNGGIGAVLYNGETTLKRIYSDQNGLHLVAANEEFPNVYIKPEVFEEVRILGRYIGRVTFTEGRYRMAA